jgi:phenylacetate-coenzyme A ligase PaaK-like adenylate-forming protein
METMDPEELRRFQEEKFFGRLDYVFENFLFYWKKFEQGGVAKEIYRVFQIFQNSL